MFRRDGLLRKIWNIPCRRVYIWDLANKSVFSELRVSRWSAVNKFSYQSFDNCEGVFGLVCQSVLRESSARLGTFCVSGVLRTSAVSDRLAEVRWSVGSEQVTSISTGLVNSLHLDYLEIHQNRVSVPSKARRLKDCWTFKILYFTNLFISVKQFVKRMES